MDCVLACLIVPHTSFRDGAPLRFCTFVVYACQNAAILERPIAYRRDTVRDRYARQATATAERILVNLVVLSVVVIRQSQFRFGADIAQQIVHTVVSVEQISFLIYYATASAFLYVQCMVSNLTVT